MKGGHGGGTTSRRVSREAKSNKSYKITLKYDSGGGCRAIGGCRVSTIYLAPRSIRVRISLTQRRKQNEFVKGRVRSMAVRARR